jgi:hypothetical protein
MSAPPEALMSSAARTAFESFTTTEQEHIVDKLLGLIRDLRDGTDDQRKAFGMPWSDDQSENERTILNAVDQCYWQLAQFFRVRRNPVIDFVIFHAEDDIVF